MEMVGEESSVILDHPNTQKAKTPLRFGLQQNVIHCDSRSEPKGGNNLRNNLTREHSRNTKTRKKAFHGVYFGVMVTIQTYFILRVKDWKTLHLVSNFLVLS